MAEGLLDKANIILTPTGYKAGTMYNVAPIEQPYEDFDFARASVASRVNSSGLVEMVGRTLGSNLVQNGDFSEIGTDLVQNGTFNLGPELVTNGDFSNGTTGWSSGNSTLSVVDGKLKVLATSAFSYARQDITAVSGKTYKITANFFYNSLVGNIEAYDGTTNTISEQLSEDGVITLYVTPSSTNLRLTLLNRNGSSGDFNYWDNVSVKEVPDWSLGGAATIENDALHLESATNEYSYARQDISSLAAKTYKIQLEIKNYVSGACQVGFTGSSPNLQNLNVTSDGTYTAYVSPNANGNDLEISREYGGGNFNFDVDTVVVQELDPNDYWTLGTGWSLGDGVASCDGTQTGNSSLSQSSALPSASGKTYKITFTISNYVSGSVQVYPTNTTVGTYPKEDANGTYTKYVKVTSATPNDILYIQANSTFIGSVSNVVVQEVIDTNNIPRINYDSNGDNGHWLLEPTSTNLITYSEDFTQWTLGSNSTLTYESDVVAPDGSLGVYRLTLPATSSTYIQSPLFTYNNPITLSIYAKYADASNNEFDLYDGTNTTRKITTSEWQRFDAVGFGNQLTIVNHGDTYITDIYIWGGQAEALPYATSYIPTLTGSTETRATETANGAGSADLINSTEGVLYAEIAALDNDQSERQISIDDGSGNNRIILRYNSTSNNINAYLFNGSVQGGEFNHTLTDITSFIKVGFKWKANDFALWVNGVEVGSDSSGTTFSADTLNDISFDFNGLYPFYGKCKELAVFGEALSDDELEKLTSWSSFNAMATDLGYTIE